MRLKKHQVRKAVPHLRSINVKRLPIASLDKLDTEDRYKNKRTIKAKTPCFFLFKFMNERKCRVTHTYTHNSII